MAKPVKKSQTTFSIRQIDSKGKRIASLENAMRHCTNCGAQFPLDPWGYIQALASEDTYRRLKKQGRKDTHIKYTCINCMKFETEHDDFFYEIEERNND